jgi:two-component system chemotaxis response regulator CheY
MRDLLSGFFANKLGFQVLATGSNGIHAVALYKQHRPDLITLDITMPVKDGKDALKEILEVHPEARVLLITALVGSPVVECLKLGAADYVEKPLELDNPLFVEEFTAIVDQAMSS